MAGRCDGGIAGLSSCEGRMRCCCHRKVRLHWRLRRENHAGSTCWVQSRSRWRRSTWCILPDAIRPSGGAGSEGRLSMSTTRASFRR